MNRICLSTTSSAFRVTLIATLILAFGKISHSQTESIQWETAKSDASVPVRCLSYNIRYANPRDGEDIWPNRKEAVAKVLDGVDVFGLQEALPSQLEDLQKLTNSFLWYGIGRNDGKLAGETTAIGWRKDRFKLLAANTFWLSPTPDKVGSKGWDAALPRIASWVLLLDIRSGKTFTFLNTHFDHRGSEARAQSAALIRKWCSEHQDRQPFVVTGDLNAQMKSEPLNNLLSSSEDANLIPLFNARELAEVKDWGPDSTWNGFRKIEPGRRIDFILTSEAIRVAQFTTLVPKTENGRYASDHLPVMAQLEF